MWVSRGVGFCGHRVCLLAAGTGGKQGYYLGTLFPFGGSPYCSLVVKRVTEHILKPMPETLQKIPALPTLGYLKLQGLGREYLATFLNGPFGERAWAAIRKQ